LIVKDLGIKGFEQHIHQDLQMAFNAHNTVNVDIHVSGGGHY